MHKEEKKKQIFTCGRNLFTWFSSIYQENSSLLRIYLMNERIEKQYIMVATKDLEIGEEITCDYREYEDRKI